MWRRVSLRAAFTLCAPCGLGRSHALQSTSGVSCGVARSVRRQRLRLQRHRMLSSGGGGPQMGLPSAETLSRASFLESVEHAATLLGDISGAGRGERLGLVSGMLRTDDGARGVFVTVLSDRGVSVADAELGDEVADALSLRDGSEEERERVRVLMAKNVAMASGMVVHYGREGETERKVESELTRERGIRVGKGCLRRDEGLRRVVREMLRGAESGEGRFVGFLRKWGYDEEQLGAIAGALREVLGGEAGDG